MAFEGTVHAQLQDVWVYIPVSRELLLITVSLADCAGMFSVKTPRVGLGCVPILDHCN